MKNFYLLLVLSFCAINIYAQDSLTFNGKQFIKHDNVWYLKTTNGSEYKVDARTITIKKEQGALTVTVFDKTGNELINGQFNTSEKVTMDISALEDGLYYIRFSNKAFFETQILIKE